MKREWTILGLAALLVGGVTYGILWLRYESRWAWSQKRILPSECPLVSPLVPTPATPAPGATFDLRIRRGVNMQSYEGSVDSGGANICIGPHVTLHDVTFHTFTEDDGGWYGTEISANCPEKGVGL